MTDRAFVKDGYCHFPCQYPLPGGGRGRNELCRVPVLPKRIEGRDSWTATGPDDAPTLSPSINCQNDTCWHGFIVSGEVHNPRVPK